MRIDPVSTYASQSLTAGSDAQQGFTRQTLDASVTTRTLGVQLGRFGMSYTTQDITFSPAQVPTDANFAQELELNGLTDSYVGPFRPAGSYSQSATIQRIGLSAYASQAAAGRSIAPMLSIVV